MNLHARMQEAAGAYVDLRQEILVECIDRFQHRKYLQSKPGPHANGEKVEEIDTALCLSGGSNFALSRSGIKYT
jgi:hypothetical protein